MSADTRRTPPTAPGVYRARRYDEPGRWERVTVSELNGALIATNGSWTYELRGRKSDLLIWDGHWVDSALTPQFIADALATEFARRRWSIFEVEIVWRAGGSGPPCTIRALVGPTHAMQQEVAGIGEDPASAVVDLCNRAEALS